MPTPATGTGLDHDGFILREGSLDLVPPAYQGIVEELRQRVLTHFPDPNGLYLYGSVPRGTAVPASSDLDALLVLTREPTDADRATLDMIERRLESAHPHVVGVGILVCSRERALSEAERYDAGFFVRCLCTPLHGEDLATHLPRYRPSTRLARDTNGDIADALARARADVGDRRVLCRRLARKMIRTALTLVMPRWNGWTSDMALTHQVVSGYYPTWREPLRRTIRLAREPEADAVEFLLEFGVLITREYARQVGLKTPG